MRRVRIAGREDPAPGQDQHQRHQRQRRAQQAGHRMPRVVDRESGVERADEIGDGADQAEVAEIPRAVGGLGEQADHVLQGDVKERERQAGERRGDVERGQRAHEVRQHQRARAADRGEREQRPRARAVRQRADRPRQQQGEQIEQPAEHPDHRLRRAQLERVEREHDAGRVQAGEEEEREGKREIDRHWPSVEGRGSRVESGRPRDECRDVERRHHTVERRSIRCSMLDTRLRICALAIPLPQSLDDREHSASILWRRPWQMRLSFRIP